MQWAKVVVSSKRDTAEAEARRLSVEAGADLDPDAQAVSIVSHHDVDSVID